MDYFYRSLCIDFAVLHLKVLVEVVMAVQDGEPVHPIARRKLHLSEYVSDCSMAG